MGWGFEEVKTGRQESKEGERVGAGRAGGKEVKEGREGKES